MNPTLFWPLVLLYVVLAQSDGFWQTDTGRGVGRILSVFIAVAAIAGGIKGARYLASTMMDANRWGTTRLREHHRREDVIEQITSEEGGWADLHARVTVIEQRLGEVQLTLTGLAHGFANGITDERKD